MVSDNVDALRTILAAVLAGEAPHFCPCDGCHEALTASGTGLVCTSCGYEWPRDTREDAECTWCGEPVASGEGIAAHDAAHERHRFHAACARKHREWRGE